MHAMSQRLFYCKSWFRAKKKPTEIWTEQRARAAHVARTLYTAVVVGSNEDPRCFLEVNDKFVGVGFLDDRLRESLYYAFKEVEPGRLFLSMATYREFQSDSDVVTSGTTYIFAQTGTVQIQKQSFNPDRMEATSSTIDVSLNYEQRPEFGEYDRLTRIERGI